MILQASPQADRYGLTIASGLAAGCHGDFRRFAVLNKLGGVFFEGAPQNRATAVLMVFVLGVPSPERFQPAGLGIYREPGPTRTAAWRKDGWLQFSVPVSCNMAVGQNQWYDFGIGAPPMLVYFSGDWGTIWLLTHGHIMKKQV